MPLADYYHRDAVAISQVLTGFDEQALTARVESVRLGISFSKGTAQSLEGMAILRLLVRLAARLYPTLVLRPSTGADRMVTELAELARKINPSIAIESGISPSINVQVGEVASRGAAVATTIFVGSNGWNALVSTHKERPIGQSTNAFGAGAAACLAMANVFRQVFLENPDLDTDLIFPTVPKGLSSLGSSNDTALPELVMVGLGAVGNAALWSLAASSVGKEIHLVDPEAIELSNLQRYVLAERSDVGAPKVEIAATHASRHIGVRIHATDWAAFSEAHRTVPLVLVAVDSARVRRSIQASLPRTIVNSWTQPGDLGVSVHRFDGKGACLACLYLPDGVSPSEDAIYAQALRIPDQVVRVRTLLADGGPVPRDLLELVSDRLEVNRELVLSFEGQGLHELYSEGICGGAILPLGRTGLPRAEVHVPLAHQSALAGVLLGAQAAGLRKAPARTPITRVNVMRSINRKFLTQFAAKDPRGICICQDKDYLEVYRHKYAVN